MFQTIFNALSKANIFTKIIDKLPGREKMSEEEQAAAELALQKATFEALQQDSKALQTFILKYEGEAKDMPKIIQVIRGLVRPLITYATFGFFVWHVHFLLNNVMTLEQVKLDIVQRSLQLNFWILILVLGFWFGDRLLTRIGFIDGVKGLFDKGESR